MYNILTTSFQISKLLNRNFKICTTVLLVLIGYQVTVIPFQFKTLVRTNTF